MNFFDYLEEILECGDLNVKFDKFYDFYAKFCENLYKIPTNFTPKILKNPSYAKFCEVIDLKDAKKIKAQKQQKFLHSIAHIEYSAIDIAIDAVYRFGGSLGELSFDFCKDWLEVAKEEISHFKMIENFMHKNEIKYGDLPVHNGLFIALSKTQNSLLERMAVIPRFMEANGLDSNFFIMQNLPKNSEILPILKVILEEEISHVKKGDKWFKIACKNLGFKNENFSEIWFKIVLKHYPKSFSQNRQINKNDRLKAGFSQYEIDKMENKNEKNLFY